MKLEPRTFQIYWDAHAWVGVIGALLLYVMFFMGAFALFLHELNVWADPTPARAYVASEQALQPLLEQLHAQKSVFGLERVAFIREGDVLTAYTSGEEFQEYTFSPEPARLEPLKSELGSFLYSLHYLGPIPYGIYVAGVASMALLLALVTGVLIHLKDLVRQWFQFRPARAARTWSSDLHKVLGVFGLPYQVMYAWTGAVIALAYVGVEPAFKAVVFRGDERAVALARGESDDAPKPTGVQTGKLPDIDALLRTIEQTTPALDATWIGLENVGDEASTLSVYGKLPGVAFGDANVLVRVSDGAVLSRVLPESSSSLQRFEAWFFGLHFAHFGGYGLKLVYALLAFATCAVMITGNLVWLERRDARRRHAGNRILERLTVAFGSGLPLATGAMLVANRVLAPGLHARAALEQWVFWSSWVLVAGLAFLPRASRSIAGAQLLAASALFVLAPILDALAHPGALSSALHRSVDLGLLALALGCAAAGARLVRRAPRTTTHVERSAEDEEHGGGQRHDRHARRIQTRAERHEQR